MKLKNRLFLLIMSSAVVFSSCGLLSGTSDAKSENKKTGSGNVLEDIFNTVMGKLPITQQSMVGTWNFQGTSCAFETENLLKKAGGAVVATQVEDKFDETCTKLGISEKNTGFDFHADSTYTGRIGGMKISGKYMLNPESKQVQMTYLLGVGKLKATVAVSSREMKLLFDADSFLKLMKIISQFTNDASIEVLGKMADMYDGMLLGFDMRKQ